MGEEDISRRTSIPSPQLLANKAVPERELAGRLLDLKGGLEDEAKIIIDVVTAKNRLHIARNLPQNVASLDERVAEILLLLFSDFFELFALLRREDLRLGLAAGRGAF